VTTEPFGFELDGYQIRFSEIATDQYETLSIQEQSLVATALRSLINEPTRTRFFMEIREGSPTGAGVMMVPPFLFELRVERQRVDVALVHRLSDPRQL
jgi:hypothetical protein